MRSGEKHLFVITSRKPLELAMILETAINLASNGELVSYIDITTKSSKTIEFPIGDRLNSITFKIKLQKIKKKLNALGIEEINHSFKISDTEKTSIVEEYANSAAKNEIISLKRESNPCLECNKNLYFDLISVYKSTYFNLERILKEYTFSNVYIYNGRFIVGNAVWNLCVQKKTNVKFLEQAHMSFPDRYWVFDKPVHSPEYRAEIVEEFYEMRNRTQKSSLDKYSHEWYSERIAGISQNFTSNQTKSYRKVNKEELIISYFHSSEDELILSNLKETSWGSQFEIINSLCELIKLRDNFKFLIRIHPNLKYKSRKEIEIWSVYLKKLKKRYTNVEYFWFDSPVNTYSLIKNSQIVFTSGSTIGPESAFMGKSNVLCGNSLYSKMGMSYKPRNAQDLKNNLDFYLKHSKKNEFIENAKKFGYFQMLGGLRYKSIEMNRSATRINFDGIMLNYDSFYSAIIRLERLIHRFFRSRRSCYKC